MNLVDKLQAIWVRHQDVHDQLMTPELAADPARFIRLNREYKELDEIVQARARYLEALANRDEAQQMLDSEKDPEVREMAQEEYDASRSRIAALETEIKELLIPKDPEDAKDAVLEVRAGTGGDEASLFAAELFRLYSRYADEHGWKIQPMSSSTSERGGFKEVIFLVTGSEVYRQLKFESGVHRVQRVPVTEANGRIHTSTVTVAVLPEAAAKTVPAAGKLGITVEAVPADVAERLKLDGRGVRISSVAEDGPARDKLAAGSDIVLEVLYPTPRRAVKTVADLQGVLSGLKDGDYVSLLVRNIDPRVGDRVVNIRVGG